MREQIEKWCAENNCAIIDLTGWDVPVNIVLRIAERATDIDNIYDRTRKEGVVFARFLAISYLDGKLKVGELADMFGMNHTVMSYVRKQCILTKDLKYFKPWQRQAITYFKNKINEVENKIRG